MTDYGITKEGFIVKPLPVILAEIEALMITEFGPDVIQTPQSPLPFQIYNEHLWILSSLDGVGNHGCAQLQCPVSCVAKRLIDYLAVPCSSK